MTFPLPDELTGSIFNYLDIPSLLRCMQVCKLFHSIISESIRLVYGIELFASYMEDNEHSSMDTVNRLNLLREHNRVWNNMEWTASGSVPLADDCWEFSGGILAQVTHGNILSFVQLPCKLKGIPERSWSVPFDFRIRDFALDNSQDLVVLLELVGTFPNESCNIHLRTLSGEQHPRTAVTQITHVSPSLNSGFSFLIQICGNRLAILIFDQLDFDASSKSSFLVWSWRTGQQELFIHTTGFKSYAFMTEDLILAAILRSDSEPTLQVLRVAAHIGPIHSVEDIPCVCELQFPEVRGSVEYFLIRSEPTPTWKPPAGSGVPFYSSRKDFIFTISVRILVNDMEESVVLFVPLSTLVSEVERSHDAPRRNVPWDAWGPDGTRMISMEPSETWVRYTYGTKFIQDISRESRHAVQVCDFNPYAARKYVKTTANSPIPWVRLVEESNPSDLRESFYDPEQVVTRLPGRVATIALELHPGPRTGWDAAMIGEDHIVVVQPLSSKYSYIAM